MNNNTYFNDVIPYLVDYYNQFETLPTKVLECTKGTGSYTCFGQNLKNKVEKVGSIEKLLRTFVGRGAKKKATKTAPTVEATVTKRTRPSRSKAAIAARAALKDQTVEIITPTTATV
jgi:hypothetical protein